VAPCSGTERHHAATAAEPSGGTMKGAPKRD
jgi:hypothetical protein